MWKLSPLRGHAQWTNRAEYRRKVANVHNNVQFVENGNISHFHRNAVLHPTRRFFLILGHSHH